MSGKGRKASGIPRRICPAAPTFFQWIGLWFFLGGVDSCRWVQYLHPPPVEKTPRYSIVQSSSRGMERVQPVENLLHTQQNVVFLKPFLCSSF